LSEPSPVSRRLTPDAVVVVPGIMGSELYDTVLERYIWGLRPGWYVRAWSPKGAGLEPLAATEAELTGDARRVRATGLLKVPAFAPVFAGIEPYTPLVTAITKVVRHPDAVLEFPYDWRLAVGFNARLLAEAVQRHLAAWRARSDQPDARVVLVAHSMGGLLCEALGAIPGATDGVRAVLTLGTPFDGAAKAAVLLGSGGGAPLPPQRLRAVAVRMPGVYDLLPAYRCVDDGDIVRRLVPADVAALGGDAVLAAAAFEQRESRHRTPLLGHRALVGVEQPTVASLTLRDGLATGHPYTFEPDEDGELVRDPNGVLRRRPGLGDGTVPRDSALPRHGVEPMPLAQQHATLAHSGEAITFVRDFLLHGTTTERPRLGIGDVGVALPDVVRPGVEWTATLTGIEAPHATVTATDVETGVEVPGVPFRRGDTVLAAVTLPSPGLYRVRVTGGTTPVSQLVLAEDPS
jgi:lecithin:cholesterol acyltransferase